MRIAVFVSALFMSVVALSSAHASEWVVDSAHTSATFSIKHMMVTNVRGEFQKVSGFVTLDDKDLTKSKVELVLDASSLSTHEPKRDAHLKSPDFFDVEKFPTVTFKSTNIHKQAEGKYKVTGDLSMHGVTKSVTLEVEGPSQPMKGPDGKLVRTVAATGKINRKDWGLSWNRALESGGLLVGEEVALMVDVELDPKPVGPA